MVLSLILNLVSSKKDTVYVVVEEMNKGMQVGLEILVAAAIVVVILIIRAIYLDSK